jgi:hypothetical protein
MRPTRAATFGGKPRANFIMAKTPNKKPGDEMPRVPFNDALRKILKAPPHHKTATKGKKKTGS